MLQSIEIENFRCFHRSRLENFGQVNLIGGMNNAGKTALLEALLLANVPTGESIDILQQVRLEYTYIYEERPELAWGNLFFKQDKNAVIKLKGQHDNIGQSLVTITCEERPKSMRKSNGELVKITDSAVSLEVGVSTLVLVLEIADWNFETRKEYNWEHDSRKIKYGPSTSSNKPLKPEKNTFLVPSNFKKSPDLLAADLDKAKLGADADALLSAFQIIDGSIKKIDVINLNPAEPRIHVFRDGEPPQPLNFFGDALNKIADLILRVVNNPNCILLIDEIENGIHHTNQQEFWRMLIKLAVQKNVQIFATSHSAEMIGAFQAAAVENQQEDKVRYITLYRSARTGEIIGAQRDMETLGYNLRTDNPYRGE